MGYVAVMSTASVSYIGAVFYSDWIQKKKLWLIKLIELIELNRIKEVIRAKRLGSWEAKPENRIPLLKGSGSMPFQGLANLFLSFVLSPFSFGLFFNCLLAS